jgi:YVTN family beta-propeller protein
MKPSAWLTTICAVACSVETLIASAAPFAYIACESPSEVWVIDVATQGLVTKIGLPGTGHSAISVNPAGTRVYVTNISSSSVSVIDTLNNSVVASVPVGSLPDGLTVLPNGNRAYVANNFSSNVSVLDAVTNTPVTLADVGGNPRGVAVDSAGTKVYVANSLSFAISVIDTASNAVASIPIGVTTNEIATSPTASRAYVTAFTSVKVVDTAANNVIATVPGFVWAAGVAVHPAGNRVYVADRDANAVQVIDATTNSAVASVPVGDGPLGVAIDPTGTKLYVVNSLSNNVTVIDTATNTQTGTIAVGGSPGAIGLFIGPAGISGQLPVAVPSLNLPMFFVLGLLVILVGGQYVLSSRR